jgi:hypothetical protein
MGRAAADQERAAHQARAGMGHSGTGNRRDESSLCARMMFWTWLSSALGDLEIFIQQEQQEERPSRCASALCVSGWALMDG